MKNKIMKTSLALALMVSSAGVLAGCSTEEVKNTTETTIDTATSIIPVEYSKELAQAVLASALANSLKETNLKSEYTTDVYTFGGIDVEQTEQKVTSVYLQEGNKITEKATFSLGSESMDMYTISILQEDNSYKYYALETTGKEYAEIVRNSFYYFGSDTNTSLSSIYGRMYLTGVVEVSTDDGYYLTESLLENVIGGRYFDGKTYINAKLNYAGDWGALYSEKKDFNAEYIIENGKISSIRILMNYKKLTAGNDEISNTADDKLSSEQNVVTSVVYTYGEQVIDGAPTSLTGYTENQYVAARLLKK